MATDQLEVTSQCCRQDNIGTDATLKTSMQSPASHNRNQNRNNLRGQGDITNINQIFNYNIVHGGWGAISLFIAVVAVVVGVAFYSRGGGVQNSINGDGPKELLADQAQSSFDTDLSFGLPPRPVIFHGREDFITDTVRLLTQPETARIAVVGAGGMGKTTVALELIHDTRIMDRYDCRLFQSCEALLDTDNLIRKLAVLLAVPANTPMLRAAVVAKLSDDRRTLLVLDNIETIWLVGDYAAAAAFDEFLGMLAQVPLLSLVITCRGIVRPPSVQWSNSATAILEPFSLEAAMHTFEDIAGRRLTGYEATIARELLNLTDRMPLAVTLLGRLVWLGNPVSKLLDRWNREHTSLLRTPGPGRSNSVEISIEISISMMQSVEDCSEALQLISVCSMLPAGVRPDILERLQTHFKSVNRALDILSAYALVSVSTQNVVKMLSPVRHLVLERYPAYPEHYDALYSIYFNFANQLPSKMDKDFKELAAAAAPEIENLSSLLLVRVTQPSQRVVDAVLSFTKFSYWHQPTVALASALLPHLEQHPQWKASCLYTIAVTQSQLGGGQRLLIAAFIAAAELFHTVSDTSMVARCKRWAGSMHRILNEHDDAEVLLKDARALNVELKEEVEEAITMGQIGILMRDKRDYIAAIYYLNAAREKLNSLDYADTVYSAFISEIIGAVYLDQGELGSAAVEMETALSVVVGLGDPQSVAHITRSLSVVRRQQGDFAGSERLLNRAQDIYEERGNVFGLAECARLLGYLRVDEGRHEEAAAYFKLAAEKYATLEMESKAEHCRMQIPGSFDKQDPTQGETSSSHEQEDRMVTLRRPKRKWWKL